MATKIEIKLKRTGKTAQIKIETDTDGEIKSELLKAILSDKEYAEAEKQKEIALTRTGIIRNNAVGRLRKIFDKDEVKEEKSLARTAKKLVQKVLGTSTVKQLAASVNRNKNSFNTGNAFFWIDKEVMFLRGYNWEIPALLSDKVMKTYLANQSLDSLARFAFNCMLNPDDFAREHMFRFVNNNGLLLTDNGYMVGFKKVRKKGEATPQKELIGFVNESILKVKKAKKSATKFVIAQFAGEYSLIPVDNKKLEENNANIIGNLADVYSQTLDSSDLLMTDVRTGKMDIRVGKWSELNRKLCDANPNIECSAGLHVGTANYVNRFNGDTILAVFVHPMDIVAVPYGDGGKMRTCRYYPFAAINSDQLKEFIDSKEYLSIADDFEKVEIANLKKQLGNKKVKNIGEQNTKMDFNYNVSHARLVEAELLVSRFRTKDNKVSYEDAVKIMKEKTTKI